MINQAIVTIQDKQWSVSVASTYSELTKGLGGMASIPAGAGMLFILSKQRPITVTTTPMLFPIDIIFIADGLVIDVVSNVAAGYLVTEQTPCDLFLEVNSGEAEGIESGDAVGIYIIQTGADADSISPVVSFAGLMILGTFMVNMGKTMATAMLKKPKQKPVLYGPRGERLLQTKTEIEFQPDSPEFLAYTIEDIGYRDKLDNAFLQAMARAKELK